MAQIFPPGITPANRNFSPGEFPQTIFESQNGAKTVLRYGSKRINASLSLSFKNITDGQVGLILDHYDDVNSVWDYVKFTSDNGTAGIIDPGSGNYFTKEIEGISGTGETSSGLRWRYAKAPQVSSGTYPGVSNVSCSFVACMDGT